MFETLKSCARSASVAGAAFSVAALAAMPGQVLAADEGSAAQENAMSVPADGQMAVRDAATGKLRAPTSEEAKALREAKGPNVVAARRHSGIGTLARSHVSGARGARLSEETMNYSVLVRQADGTLQEVCFASRAEAEAVVANPPVAKTTNNLPTE